MTLGLFWERVVFFYQLLHGWFHNSFLFRHVNPSFRYMQQLNYFFCHVNGVQWFEMCVCVCLFKCLCVVWSMHIVKKITLLS